MPVLYKSNSTRNAPVSFFITISLLFSFLVVFIPGSSFAQAPAWSSASSAGSTSSDYGKSICTDLNGNNYTTGYFSQSITFGNISLTDQGGSDVYLVKYNVQDNVVWAKSFGGTSLDFANTVSTDANGNIIITGAFRSESITFGTITLPNPNSGNAYDAFFIAKLNPDGDVLWASTASSDGNCWGNDVDTDANGNIIVTGAFDGVSTIFGTTTLNNTYQFAADLFLVKYNPSGDVLWAQSFGGNSYDYGRGVAADHNGNINLTGSFESSSITFGNTTFTNTGGSDYFIVQFNSEGIIVWLRNAIGDGDDSGNDIATDSQNDIFVTGIYAGSSITFGMNSLPGNGYDNIYIIKYESTGGIAWVQSVSGSENDEAYALAVDKDDNVLVSGEFESNPITFGAFSLPNAYPEYSDLFVAKMSPEGVVRWAVSAGGNDSDFAEGVSTNNEGNVYITGGFYSSTIVFGNTSLVNANNSNNSTDYFIAKLNSTTGIDESAANSSFFLYPNPAGNVFSVLHLPVGAGSATLALYNLNGVKLFEKETPKGSKEIKVDVSTLKNGLYFCRLTVGDKSVTKKLIVRK